MAKQYDIEGVDVDQLAENMAEETIIFLREVKMEHGFPVVATAVVRYFIKYLIVSSMSDALQGIDIKDKKGAYNAGMKALRDSKASIQEAVGLAFTEAMNAGGMQAEYYCQIKMVPEPISREIN